MTYVIAEPCVDLLDKACIEECPVDCIYEGERMLYIHPDECVDCGACEPVCPVEAIYYEDDVPDSGRPTPRPTSTSSTSWARPAARPRSARSTATRASGSRPAAAGATTSDAGLRCTALPDFPWDSLAARRGRSPRRTRTGSSTCRSARRSTPSRAVVRAALAGPAADAPGYPTTHGTAALREASPARCARRFGVDRSTRTAVLPTIGSKELVAWLPTLLGLGRGRHRRHPGAGLPDLRGRRAAGRGAARCGRTR